MQVRLQSGSRQIGSHNGGPASSIGGVAPETVSRWEKGSLSMGAAADRLLRLMVVNKAPVEDYSLEMLKAIDESAPATFRLGVQADESGWHAVAA